ncbi:hypothetical protein [Sulfurospirillum deleyianum]|uniref:Histidine kinase n=1 Tax=Sulfurospirillum deleyianum (strain ATCC 51133 / DSM 6946 / 5175) TaxID=525898 RepID=D1B4D4_SULD5|nr:hypothetical protein [Sulfurospirillum deleyianum]ACZ12954.1 conserved hypothetical protein [Sulfurospirillum deleyianum DSM 6946]
MKTHIQKGIEKFYAKNFKEALFEFSLALNDDPKSSKARIGAFLCDLAMQHEEQALALFEYYLFNDEKGMENLENLIEEMISSIEKRSDNMRKTSKNDSLESRINLENGIKYEDFLALIQTRGSFKEAFEDIMFSTKVIISKKEDFVDFLAKLIENGFVDISLNYLETAITLFPSDEELLSLIKKIEK